MPCTVGQCTSVIGTMTTWSSSSALTRSRSPGPASAREFPDELFDPCPDLVADRSDGVDALTGGVVELPILVAFPGVERAGVAASHRDDDVGFLHGFIGEDLGRGGGDVDAFFGHRLDRDGVDLVGGLGPGGEDIDAASGKVLEVAGGHLGAAGVVDAYEQ